MTVEVSDMDRYRHRDGGTCTVTGNALSGPGVCVVWDDQYHTLGRFTVAEFHSEMTLIDDDNDSGGK